MRKCFFTMILASTLFLTEASANEGCSEACNASTKKVLGGHTSYDMVVEDKEQGSEVFITWTSRSDHHLMPVKYTGRTQKRLPAVVLYGAQFESKTDFCNITALLASEDGSKQFSIPVTNILCQAASK